MNQNEIIKRCLDMFNWCTRSRKPRAQVCMNTNFCPICASETLIDRKSAMLFVNLDYPIQNNARRVWNVTLWDQLENIFCNCPCSCIEERLSRFAIFEGTVNSENFFYQRVKLLWRGNDPFAMTMNPIPTKLPYNISPWFEWWVERASPSKNTCLALSVVDEESIPQGVRIIKPQPMRSGNVEHIEYMKWIFQDPASDGSIPRIFCTLVPLWWRFSKHLLSILLALVVCLKMMKAMAFETIHSERRRNGAVVQFSAHCYVIKMSTTEDDIPNSDLTIHVHTCAG